MRCAFQKILLQGLAYLTLAFFPLHADVLENLQTKAESGDINAQFELAEIYQDGAEAERNLGKAFKWYEKAAEKGFSTAQNRLAQMCLDGEDCPKDAVAAAKWFQKSAEQNDPVGQYNLGLLYADGIGVSKNTGEALKWLNSAARVRYPKAWQKLGSIYENGDGVIKNPILALSYYMLASDSDGKEDFKRLSSNPELMKSLAKAANDGDVTAQFTLAGMLLDGKGIDKNPKAGADLLRKAAEQGHITAQYNLGMLHIIGLGVDRDLAEAQRWFSKAALTGHPVALNNLSKLGSLQKKNTEDPGKEVLLLMKNAAEQGLPEAQYALGMLYLMGLKSNPPIEKNIHAATTYLRKAAECGDINAQRMIGEMYYKGIGLEKNDFEAAKWLRPLAEHGDPAALYQIGFIYSTCTSIPDSSDKLAWLYLCKAQGNLQLSNAIIRIENKLGMEVSMKAFKKSQALFKRIEDSKAK